MGLVSEKLFDSEFDPYLFRRLAEMGLKASGRCSLVSFGSAPFSADVGLNDQEFIVVMQVLETLERRLIVASTGQERVEFIESGVHLMFEVQMLCPAGSFEIIDQSAFVWVSRDQALAVEWSLSA